MEKWKGAEMDSSKAMAVLSVVGYESRHSAT